MWRSGRATRRTAFTAASSGRGAREEALPLPRRVAGTVAYGTSVVRATPEPHGSESDSSGDGSTFIRRLVGPRDPCMRLAVDSTTGRGLRAPIPPTRPRGGSSRGKPRHVLQMTLGVSILPRDSGRRSRESRQRGHRAPGQVRRERRARKILPASSMNSWFRNRDRSACPSTAGYVSAGVALDELCASRRRPEGFSRTDPRD